jgi:chromosome partitioning protein
MSHPLVLTTCNRKGGCFKTSGIYHLAGAFSEEKKRILLIDLDPQASLSQTFFGPSAIERWPADRSVCALFDDAMPPDPEYIIHQTSIPAISICPACDALTAFNDGRPAECDWQQDVILQLINEVAPHFDLVLIDTPPNLQLMTWAAMAASHFVFTPVIPEDYAAQGLVHVKRFIEQVTARKNSQLRWLGLLLCMVQKVAVHKVYEGSLRTAYTDLVFDASVPLAAAFKESVAAKLPLFAMKWLCASKHPHIER